MNRKALKASPVEEAILVRCVGFLMASPFPILAEKKDDVCPLSG